MGLKGTCRRLRVRSWLTVHKWLVSYCCRGQLNSELILIELNWFELNWISIELINSEQVKASFIDDSSCGMSDVAFRTAPPISGLSCLIKLFMLVANVISAAVTYDMVGQVRLWWRWPSSEYSWCEWLSSNGSDPSFRSYHPPMIIIITTLNIRLLFFSTCCRPANEHLSRI